MRCGPALTTAAATRHLLVASDYDGVLSPSCRSRRTRYRIRHP